MAIIASVHSSGVSYRLGLTTNARRIEETERRIIMTITTTATVTYVCEMSDEDAAKIRAKAKEDDISLEEAADELWRSSEIDFYSGDTTDVDCHTESVESVDDGDFEEEDANDDDSECDDGE